MLSFLVSTCPLSCVSWACYEISSNFCFSWRAIGHDKDQDRQPVPLWMLFVSHMREVYYM